jgi:hypothetical protein
MTVQIISFRHNLNYFLKKFVSLFYDRKGGKSVKLFSGDGDTDAFKCRLRNKLYLFRLELRLNKFLLNNSLLQYRIQAEVNF